MGFLGKLFSKKKESNNVADLSILETDIHSHFIPGIDDGSSSMATTIEMLKNMKELGYRKVITTPHIMSDFFKNTPEIILSGLEKVRSELSMAKIEIEIEAAAEYYLDFDFERKLNEEKLLSFGNKKYLLFEISYVNAPENIGSVAFELQMQGYIPVLAHPERYPFWYKKFEKYEELKEKGMLFQMNINSLTGYYSSDTKKIAEQLIDKGMIDFLGTDCHHIGHIELMKQCRSEEYLSKLLDSGKLLNASL